MRTILDRYDDEDKEYLVEMLDALEESPNICATDPEQNTFQIQDTIQSIKLGGPWDARVEVKQGIISDKEFIDLLWDTIAEGYGSAADVPPEVAVRLTNHIYNPTTLIDTVVSRDIDDRPADERFQILLEAAVCCIKEPRIEDWVRGEATAIAFDGLIVDAGGNNDEVEEWETDIQSAKNIVENNEVYSVLLSILSMNDSLNENLDEEDDEDKTEDDEQVDEEPQLEITEELLINYARQAYENEYKKGNLKGIDNLMVLGYLSGIVEDMLGCAADEDMLDNAIEQVLEEMGAFET